MSFDFPVGDFVLLTQLAYNTVQNSRKACGAHDELTREVTSLHIVLQRLQREVEKPNSLLNHTDDGRLEELETVANGCDHMLKVIDQVLVKYNGMSKEKRRVTRLRLKVKFGNGEMKDIEKIRQELSIYTSAITLFLNLLTMEGQGKVEEHMESHGEELRELRELRQSLNWITATLQANSGNREGSILTTYADDDKAFWKEFRRELVKEGFSSEELRKHKAFIKEYVMELGARGVLRSPRRKILFWKCIMPMKQKTLGRQPSISLGNIQILRRLKENPIRAVKTWIRLETRPQYPQMARIWITHPIRSRFLLVSMMGSFWFKNEPTVNQHRQAP